MQEREDMGGFSKKDVLNSKVQRIVKSFDKGL